VQQSATQATANVLDQFEKDVQELGTKMGLTKVLITDVLESVKTYGSSEFENQEDK
jgi:hypothetical protein